MRIISNLIISPENPIKWLKTKNELHLHLVMKTMSSPKILPEDKLSTCSQELSPERRLERAPTDALVGFLGIQTLARAAREEHRPQLLILALVPNTSSSLCLCGIRVFSKQCCFPSLLSLHKNKNIKGIYSPTLELSEPWG